MCERVRMDEWFYVGFAYEGCLPVDEKKERAKRE